MLEEQQEFWSIRSKCQEVPGSRHGEQQEPREGLEQSSRLIQVTVYKDYSACLAMSRL